MKEALNYLHKIQVLFGSWRLMLKDVWFSLNIGLLLKRLMTCLFLKIILSTSVFLFRYYGESLPFGNTSYSNLSKLGYLTSSQALADYASLLREINKPGKYSHSFKRSSIQANPVIAIGGSYGGMLAAW